MRSCVAALMGLLLCAPTALAEPAILSNQITVHVEGQVRRPGLYALPLGARRADAIQAAGGLTAGADVSSLNLANAMQDGEALRVPSPAQLAAARLAATEPVRVVARRARRTQAAAPAKVESVLDLNRATSEQLQNLPSIGPSLAADILAYRKSHGAFKSLDELREVGGIGERRLARLKPYLRV